MRTKTETTKKDLFLIANEERIRDTKLKRAYYEIKADEIILLTRQAKINESELFNAIITAYYYGKAKGRKEEISRYRLQKKER